MRKHFVATLVLLAVSAAPLAAQAAGAAHMDATAKITGSGKLPDGWMLRFDPVRSGPQHELTEINFITMGAGFHVSSGPAAIYYRSADAATGNYTVSVSLSQRKGMEHEAYGLFIGGSHLQDSTQTYLYYVVRPMDGNFLIKYRSGNATPRTIADFAADPSINKDDAKDGHATNALAIKVDATSVAFMANGKTVKTVPRSELKGISTDGVAGLRVNHNLDLHIADLKITK